MSKSTNKPKLPPLWDESKAGMNGESWAFDEPKNHTPGPWKVARSETTGAVWIENADTGQTICDLYTLTTERAGFFSREKAILFENAEEHAALIASAPDLLAENKWLREDNKQLEDLVELHEECAKKESAENKRLREALKEIANTAEFFTQHGISDAAARGGAERIVERARATLEGGE